VGRLAVVVGPAGRNFSAILDRLKRTYNVDENHVYLTGASMAAPAPTT
jgi:predicted peptidase